jgi:hypothetical protein
MKGKRYYVFGLMAMLFALLLAGCGNSGNTENAENEKEAAAEAFLTHFYTTDDGGRYTTMQSSSAETEEEVEESVDAYYSKLAELATDDLLEKLQANRMPYVYDEMDEEAGITVDSPQIELNAQQEENSYDFTVTRTEEDVRTGTIRLTETEDGYLAEYFIER